MFIKNLLYLVVLIFLPSFQTFRLNEPKSYGHSGDEADGTILMAHVIFRHGNRTAEQNETYPTDPHYNDTYFPTGRGQLTNAGKVKEYNVGLLLRKRYNKLLGNEFYPEVVDATSTDSNRTKASLLLVLASLFQPSGNQTWNPALNWQPVPYNFRPVSQDKVMFGIKCPNYEKLYQRYVNTPKLQAQFKSNKDVFDYISRNSGLKVKSFREVYDLYFGLSTEEELGQKLPSWTNKVWPKTIIDLAIQEYYVQTGNTDLLKIAEGYHIQKIIEDTKKEIHNRKQHGRKLYLYSAHENNVAEMLILLGVFNPPHIPNYGAHLMVEVHQIYKTYGIKLYYQNYVSKEPHLLKLPSCEEFCPLDRFISLVEEYLPSDNLCGYI
ncbi:hypothetical protein JTB14_017735 [Gonioctena quinquepunctata]|nr:hypothetical protein JTB14_017735 [Gonioctena quinquepunctata]